MIYYSDHTASQYSSILFYCPFLIFIEPKSQVRYQLKILEYSLFSLYNDDTRCTPIQLSGIYLNYWSINFLPIFERNYSLHQTNSQKDIYGFLNFIMSPIQLFEHLLSKIQCRNHRFLHYNVIFWGVKSNRLIYHQHHNR